MGKAIEGALADGAVNTEALCELAQSSELVMSLFEAFVDLKQVFPIFAKIEATPALPTPCANKCGERTPSGASGTTGTEREAIVGGRRARGHAVQAPSASTHFESSGLRITARSTDYNLQATTGYRLEAEQAGPAIAKQKAATQTYSRLATSSRV